MKRSRHLKAFFTKSDLMFMLTALCLTAVLAWSNPVRAQDDGDDIQPNAHWTNSVVDRTTCVGVDTQMTVDGRNFPHLVHYDSTHTGLRHSYWNGRAWINEMVDQRNDCGEEPGVAVDARGRIHVVYLAGNECRYARKVNGVWIRQVVERVARGRVGATSIAVDSDGNPHVSYTHSPDADEDSLPRSTKQDQLEGTGIKYARWNGLRWVVERLGVSGTDTDIALDAQGSPYISFKNEPTQNSHPNIVCARKNQGAWVLHYFDRTTSIGSRTGLGDTRLAVDGRGHVHVVYRDWTRGWLKYGYWNKVVWTKTVVARDAGQQEGLDIATDRLNRPHITYNGRLGRDNMALRYAYRRFGVWIVEEVDWGGNPGIAIDTAGRPHLGHGRNADDYVPRPWSVEDCEVLKYSVRDTSPYN